MLGPNNRITISQALDYESRGAGWPHYAFHPWIQKAAARWFAWKVKRKFKRYIASKDEQGRVLIRDLLLNRS